VTHITGPRKRKVDGLAKTLEADISRSGCTISESYEALHEANMALLKAALRPFERFTCPTCPTAGDLTPAQLGRIESAVKKEVQR
jgi:hypothetical protein